MKETIKAIGKRIWRDVWEFRCVILAFAAYYVAVHLLFEAFCPSVLLTGFPCAGCGMTRAVFFLLTGQFSRSWHMNPMALPIVLLAAYCMLERYVFGRRIRGLKMLVGLTGVCMLAVYCYRMYLLFPNRPPYVFTSGSLLERFLPFYRELLHKLCGI